jgi:hypothetical protein
MVGIRVLRHTDYMRVGLANDRLAEKANSRVRAFDNLRNETLEGANDQTGQMCRCQRLLRLV